MERRTTYILLAVVLIVIVAVSVFAYQLMTAPPAEGKRILSHNGVWPIYIDPHMGLGTSYVSGRAIVNLYDALLHTTLEGGVVAHLAESWSESDNHLVWTFNLRSGVKFHDGSELHADDVAFSMDRLLTLGTGTAFIYEPYIDNATVIDDYTVQFNLKQPFGSFEKSMAFFLVLNKDLVMANIASGPHGDLGDYGQEWLLTHDAGSGAYKVKDVLLEESLTMEIFSDYWGEVYSKAPEEVRFISTMEPVTIKTLMNNREHEITDEFQPLESLQALDAIEGVDLAHIFYGNILHLETHNKRPPLDDVYVRRAMSWALDYDDILDIFPYAVLSKGPVAQDTPGHNPNVMQYTRNLTKAMEELQKSKYYANISEYPIEFTWLTEIPDEEKVALAFAESMEDIGITVTIRGIPYLMAIDEMTTMETCPDIIPMFIQPMYPEAISALQVRFHSSSTGSVYQNEWLLNDTVDNWIETAMSTSDPAELLQLSYMIQEEAVNQAWAFYLVDRPNSMAWQSYYMTWPSAGGIDQCYPDYIYNYEFRFVQILNDKREELLGG